MRRLNFSVSLLLLLLSVFLGGTTLARNRFNVYTFHDDDQISNLDSFYVWLDRFGASEFYTIKTTAANFIKGDSLPEAVSPGLPDTLSGGAIRPGMKLFWTPWLTFMEMS